MTKHQRFAGDQFCTDGGGSTPLGPMASVGAGEAALSRFLNDLLLFTCVAAFVTGIVIAAAAMLI
jgi:hypothetical protein